MPERRGFCRFRLVCREAVSSAPEGDSFGRTPRSASWSGQGPCRAGGAGGPDLDDLRDMALPVLRHRMVLNFQGEAEGVPSEHLLARMVAQTHYGPNYLDAQARRRQALRVVCGIPARRDPPPPTRQWELRT